MGFWDYSVLWNREWTWKNTGEVWLLLIKLKSKEMQGQNWRRYPSAGMFLGKCMLRIQTLPGADPRLLKQGSGSHWLCVFTLDQAVSSTPSLEFVLVSHPCSQNRSLMHLEQREPGSVPAQFWWNILGKYQAVLNQALIKSIFMCQSMPASFYMQTT